MTRSPRQGTVGDRNLLLDGLDGLDDLDARGYAVLPLADAWGKSVADLAEDLARAPHDFAARVLAASTKRCKSSPPRLTP